MYIHTHTHIYIYIHTCVSLYRAGSELGAVIISWPRLAVWSCGGMYTYFKSARIRCSVSRIHSCPSHERPRKGSPI